MYIEMNEINKTKTRPCLRYQSHANETIYNGLTSLLATQTNASHNTSYICSRVKGKISREDITSVNDNTCHCLQRHAIAYS